MELFSALDVGFEGFGVLLGSPVVGHRGLCRPSQCQLSSVGVNVVKQKILPLVVMPSVRFVDCPLLGSFAMALDLGISRLLADSSTVKAGGMLEDCCGECVVMPVMLELVG